LNLETKTPPSAGQGWRSLLLAFIAWAAIPAIIPEGPSRWIVATLVIQAAFAAIALLYLRGGGILRIGPFGNLPWTLLGTAGLTFLLHGLAEPLLRLFPESRPAVEHLASDVRDLRPEIAWPLIALLAPIGEELIFRGAALRAFRSSYGTAAALALTTLIFAAIHVEPPRILMVSILGLWFGILAVRSGAPALSIAAHAVNNAIILALVRSGVESVPWTAVAAGGAGFAFSAFFLFARRGSVQGSGEGGTS